MKRQENDGLKLKDAFGILYLLLRAQSLAVTLVYRKNFGQEALGIPAFTSLLLQLGWLVATQSPVILLWIGFWFFKLIVRRVQGAKERAQGYYEHSQFGGRPEFCGWLQEIIGKTDRSARIAEGCLYLGVGFIYEVLQKYDPATAFLVPMGHLWMASGAAILLLEFIHDEANRKQVQVMRDAQIEMGWFANQVVPNGRRW